MSNPSRHPARASRTKAASMSAGFLLLALTLAATAQEKAAGVFDEEKPALKKPAAEKKTEGEKKAGSEKKDGAVSDRDSIGFTQENVSAQMTELEERMFRLSEALRSLEPENAS